jgi:hypothetical protein
MNPIYRDCGFLLIFLSYTTQMSQQNLKKGHDYFLISHSSYHILFDINQPQQSNNQKNQLTAIQLSIINHIMSRHIHENCCENQGASTNHNMMKISLTTCSLQKCTKQ